MCKKSYCLQVREIYSHGAFYFQAFYDIQTAASSTASCVESSMKPGSMVTISEISNLSSVEATVHIVSPQTRPRNVNFNTKYLSVRHCIASVVTIKECPVKDEQICQEFGQQQYRGFVYYLLSLPEVESTRLVDSRQPTNRMCPSKLKVAEIQTLVFANRKPREHPFLWCFS